MKKFLAATLCLLCALGLTACKSQTSDTVYCGLNAEIVDIDPDSLLLTVRSLDETSLFGDSCAIDCSGVTLLYCDFETLDLIFLDFADLQTGDAITLTVSQTELDKAGSAPIQADIQLMTQRLNIPNS